MPAGGLQIVGRVRPALPGYHDPNQLSKTSDDGLTVFFTRTTCIRTTRPNRGSVSWHAKEGYSAPSAKSRQFPVGDEGALPNHDSRRGAALCNGHHLRGQGVTPCPSPGGNAGPTGGTASPGPIPPSPQAAGLG